MKLPTVYDIVNLWLFKYHSVRAEDVGEGYLDKYPCTQEQHDQWVRDCEKLRAKFRIPKWMWKRYWPWVYLDYSPKIRK